MTTEELDWAHEQAEDFVRRFKALVREFFPEYPRDDEVRMALLFMCQDRTSMFSAYIWSDPDATED